MYWKSKEGLPWRDFGADGLLARCGRWRDIARMYWESQFLYYRRESLYWKLQFLYYRSELVVEIQDRPPAWGDFGADGLLARCGRWRDFASRC